MSPRGQDFSNEDDEKLLAQVRRHPSQEGFVGWESRRSPGKVAVDAAAGRYRVNVDRVFASDEIVETHRYMDDNRASRKLVVLLN